MHATTSGPRRPDESRRARRLTALVVVTTGVLVASASVYAALSRSTPSPTQSQARDDASRLLASWGSSGARSAGRLELDALYPPRGPRRMIEPATALPAFSGLELDELRRLRHFARSCEGDAPSHASNKAWTWHRHRCGAAPLPTDFFSTWPWSHPTGRSYVALAIEDPEIPTPPAWIEDHLGFVHVRELAAILDRVDGDLAAHRLLAALEPDALQALYDGQQMILTRAWLLQRDAAGYALFERDLWDRHLGDEPLRLAAVDEEGPCLANVSGLCWKTRERDERAAIANAALASASLSLLALVCGVAMMLRERVHARRRDHDERLFVLRTLTHELRTPAAGLTLSLDPLRQDFDALSEPSQDAFLRLCDEVGRLNRVLSVTGRYLQLHGRGGEETAVLATLDDPGAFLEELLEPFEVALTRPDTPAPFRTSPVWLAICVRNLVENAMVHGQPPITVTLSRPRRGHLEIAVQDAGTGLERPLEELAQAFERRAESAGLGLGLSIVARIVALLGGTLTLRPNPTTTFVIHLEELLS